MENEIPLIVIAGPTASGKTKLAIEIAKVYNCEIVSADSMQIYKGLSIATAKPTVEEMQDIKHHLIDFLPPEKTFSVADYVKLAKEKISDIYSRGKIPILCGGTGLYISSVIDNIKFDETSGDEKIRKELVEYANENGNHALWLKLNEIDKKSAASIHENNLSRVIRAIEVYKLTGKTLSEQKVDSRREKSPYNTCIIGIGFEDRRVLYERINQRVDNMLADGLVEEVRDFYNKHIPITAHQAIGYKELIPYIEGKTDLESSIEKIKQETRHYAKRQLTWFRRVDGIKWINVDKIDKYKNFVKKVENVIAKSDFMCYNID